MRPGWAHDTHTGDPPCQGCADREMGCHAVCPRYQAYAKGREAVYDARARASRMKGCSRVQNLTRAIRAKIDRRTGGH